MRMPMDALSFADQHKHIRYCDAVVHPDGRVEYSVPSHLDTLMRIGNLTMKDIPDDSMPLFNLIDRTGCAVISFDMQSCQRMRMKGSKKPYGY